MRILVVLLVGACGFEPGSSPGDGGSGGDDDRPIDMMPDMFDARCFGKAPFTICLQNVPIQPLTLPINVNTSDTGNDNCTQVGGEIAKVSGIEVCALAGTDVTASGPAVGVTGGRPLAVVATGTLTVSTMNFDISSSNSGGKGPGANPDDCAMVASMNGGGTNGGGGGGAGGTFAGAGGKGGDGANGATGAEGGRPRMGDSSFDKLRGGCAGGSGGFGGTGTTIVPGGDGGGALYLVARGVISITGNINASGAGGDGGDGDRGGGGGGGSGGMVVLFAPNLSIGASGRVFANGGGGGGGAGNTATDGTAGEDGHAPHMPALGGEAAASQGTRGGNGEYDAVAPGSPATATQGGGGGGGGIGVIRILSGQSTGWAPINVSPMPKLN